MGEVDGCYLVVGKHGCGVVGESMFAEKGKWAVDVFDCADVLDIEDKVGGVGTVGHDFCVCVLLCSAVSVYCALIIIYCAIIVINYYLANIVY